MNEAKKIPRPVSELIENMVGFGHVNYLADDLAEETMRRIRENLHELPALCKRYLKARTEANVAWNDLNQVLGLHADSDDFHRVYPGELYGFKPENAPNCPPLPDKIDGIPAFLFAFEKHFYFIGESGHRYDEWQTAKAAQDRIAKEITTRLPAGIWYRHEQWGFGYRANNYRTAFEATLLVSLWDECQSGDLR